MIERLLQRYARNSSRVHLRRINEEFAKEIPPGALVLDAAAGDQPYRLLFAHARYESADFEKLEKEYGTTTHVCDLASIPVEQERFDYIIFNQGLEHMPDPKAVLIELGRVLKRGGKIIITAPFFYEEHEKPYDFYRYTQFAYRHLLSQAGIEIERLEWVEGYLGTLAYQLQAGARYLPRRMMFIPIRLMLALLAIWFYRLDVRNPYKKHGYPKNYAVIGAKL